jgi:hypothetical protein
MKQQEIDTYAHVRAGIDGVTLVAAGVSLVGLFFDNEWMTFGGMAGTCAVAAFGKATDFIAGAILSNNETEDGGYSRYERSVKNGFVPE